jgi:hypothetical protein
MKNHEYTNKRYPIRVFVALFVVGRPTALAKAYTSPSTCRAITRRWISLVPSPMVVRRLSR